jgi:hypothetical protein
MLNYIVSHRHKLSWAVYKTIKLKNKTVMNYHLLLLENIKWLKFCIGTEFHLQNLGAVLVVEEGVTVASTVSVLLARVHPGN